MIAIDRLSIAIQSKILSSLRIFEANQKIKKKP